MGILEFLELFGISYEKFSKEKSRLITKWRILEPSLEITGQGREAMVYAKSYDVFFFQRHAKTSWNIVSNIDYKLLYEVYKTVIDYDGEYLPPYIVLGKTFGAHQNTIAKYVNLLDEYGIVKKQVVFESANRKRVKALPMFHEPFKPSLLKELQEQEIDWHNHVF